MLLIPLAEGAVLFLAAKGLTCLFRGREWAAYLGTGPGHEARSDGSAGILDVGKWEHAAADRRLFPAEGLYAPLGEQQTGGCADNLILSRLEKG